MKFYVFVFLCCGFMSWAQDSTLYNLSEVNVSASISQAELKDAARNVTIIDQKTIRNAPVQTISGVLQYALNVDVRTRSPYGVQADVSIRGGHFDQTLVLLDGIKMNDPQTGHHTMNLPVPLEMIERIEVLQGGASRVFGPSAFSGVINVVTKKKPENQVVAELTGGQYGLLNGSVSASYNFGNETVMTSGNLLRSDGYAYNTAFDRKTAYVNWHHSGVKSMIRFQAGFLANHFGASNFYHPKFYDQYEETNAIFSSLSWEHHLNKNLQSLVNLSIRKHSDLYDFNTYRLAETSWGSVNFHQTDVYDGEWKLKYRWAGGVTSGGLEFRNEGILSNRLGEELTHPIPVKDFEGQYLTKGINRNNFSGYLEHQKRWQTFLISAGSLVNFNSQFGTEFYPGIDMSWFPANGMTVYTSVNRSLRFPTFTELYLNTSTVRADPLLLPEKAVNYELGYKWFKPHWNMTFAAFYKQTRDAIDKIKHPELSVPTMENIDNINMTGIEWNASWSFDSRPNSILSIDRLILNYAALKADRKEDGFQSFYTLNYLRQNLTGGVTLKTLEDLSLSVFGTYRARAGAYQWDSESPLLPYKDVYLLDMRIDYKLKRFNFYADCRNLLNFTYQDFGFVEQPGIWVSGGLRVSFL